jgi:hypothetical protein
VAKASAPVLALIVKRAASPPATSDQESAWPWASVAVRVETVVLFSRTLKAAAEVMVGAVLFEPTTPMKSVGRSTSEAVLRSSIISSGGASLPVSA